MTVQVFPVRPVVAAEATYITRGGRRKRCINTERVWYADWHEQARGQHKHHAQDIFAPLGSPVLAPEGGVVVASSRSEGPTPKGGHYVKIAVINAQRQTVRTYYLAHLHRVPLVSTGDPVFAGDQVGEVGQSGNAVRTCPHLHIGARRYVRGRAINLYPELVRVDPSKAGRRRPTPPRPTPPTQATKTSSSESDCKAAE